MAKETQKEQGLKSKKEGLIIIWNRLPPAFKRSLIIVSFIILTSLVLPGASITEYKAEVNTIWTEPDLVAPFDFPIYKPSDSLQKERAQAIKKLPEVFFENTAIKKYYTLTVDSFFSRLESIQKKWKELSQSKNIDLSQLNISDPDEAELDKLIAGLKPELDRKALQYFLARPAQIPSLYKTYTAIRNEVFYYGYIDKAISEIESEVISVRNESQYERLIHKNNVMDREKVAALLKQQSLILPQTTHYILSQLFNFYVLPNYIFNDSVYQIEKQYALNAISPYASVVKKGEIIAPKGGKITKEVAAKIRSLNLELQQYQGRSTFIEDNFIGKLLVVSILTFITVFYLNLNRRELFVRWQKILMLFIILFLMVLLSAVAEQFYNQFSNLYNINIFFLIPLCMAPILITTFFDDRIGFLSNIVVALLVALTNQHSFEFFFIQICAGTVTVFKIKLLRRREQFFTTAAILLVVYIVTYLSYNLYTKDSWHQINFGNLVLFFMNVTLTLSAFPLIYVFEKIFDFTSDITLIELLDNDHPILKNLYEKAPGTYQHSLQVANIAEEVAKKIGANALLVHVGALFHDIGKIEKADYFTENQKSGENPHLAITALNSAQIIIDHVHLGEVMARDYKLPIEILEFIKTHHGTTRVEFFYRKFQEEFPEQASDKEHLFRYKGPLPTTKEQAILMIADSIEAAARSLSSTTRADLEKLIETIIAAKINDNQLIHANISFRDLTIMKREILRILSSIYHNRVKYPEPDKKMIV
jgi:putative nucleotidyltransferase with HDIG domain